MVAVKYVDPLNGSDSRDGTTIEGAFLTPGAAQSAASAGDVVELLPTADYRTTAFTFNKALEWRVYGWEPGGTARFRFLGSVQKTGWAYDSANRWGVAQAADPYTVSFVTAAGLWIKGNRKLSKAAVVSAYDWFWESGTTTLWSFSPPDSGGAAVAPTTNYAAIEAGAGGSQLADGSTITGLTLRGLDFRGAAGSGLNLTGCTSRLAEDCEFGFNGEDGYGGTSNVSAISRRCLTQYNGDVRPADLGSVGSRGDGHSEHGTGSYLLEDCVSIGDLKAAQNSVQSAAGTVRRCRSFGSNLNFLAGATAETVYEHCLVVLGETDIGGFGAAGPAKFISCGAYGAGAAVGTGDNNTAFTFFDVGAVTAKNCWAVNAKTGFRRTVLGLGGAFVERCNAAYGNGTAATGFTPHASFITAAPLFADEAGEDFRLSSESPYLLAGVDSSGIVSATALDGVARPGGAWDVGPYQRRAIPREVALAALKTALEGANVDDDDWRVSRVLTQVLRRPPSANAGLVPPYAFFNSVAESLVYQGSHGADDMRSRTMTVELVVISDGWDIDAEPSRVVYDVERALADHTLGGSVDTVVIRANREAINDGRCFVAVTIDLMYRTGRLDPAQRV